LREGAGFPSTSLRKDVKNKLGGGASTRFSEPQQGISAELCRAAVTAAVLGVPGEKQEEGEIVPWCLVLSGVGGEGGDSLDTQVGYGA